MAPFGSHYVGIESGGEQMVVAIHTDNPSTTYSIIKKDGRIFGKKPEAPYILVDDVVTTESSLGEAIDILGRSPEKIFVAVDRREPQYRKLEIISAFEI